MIYLLQLYLHWNVCAFLGQHNQALGFAACPFFLPVNHFIVIRHICILKTVM